MCKAILYTCIQETTSCLCWVAVTVSDGCVSFSHYADGMIPIMSDRGSHCKHHVWGNKEKKVKNKRKEWQIRSQEILVSGEEGKKSKWQIQKVCAQYLQCRVLYISSCISVLAPDVYTLLLLCIHSLRAFFLVSPVSYALHYSEQECNESTGTYIYSRAGVEVCWALMCLSENQKACM